MTRRPGRALHRAQRGQVLAVLALTASMLLAFTALGLNTATDRGEQLGLQRAVDFAGLSAARVWSGEIQQNALQAPPAAATDPTFLAAQGVAELNGIPVSKTNRCTIALVPGARIDIVFYDKPTPCGSGVAQARQSVEISIPPSAPVPASCVPAFECVRITGRMASHHPLAQFLSGVIQTTSVAYASVSNLRAWGNNNAGQLGDGTVTNRHTPVEVIGLSEVVSVQSASNGVRSHSLALRSDGTVWAWGDNSYGQLGNGTNISTRTPVQVLDRLGTGPLSQIIEIGVLGDGSSMALNADGSLQMWGNNSHGQLGHGTTVNSNLPVRVNTRFGAFGFGRHIAGGFDHAIAVTIDGSVWAWGRNSSGQLGVGSLVDQHFATQVPGLVHGAQVTAGDSHSVALLSDGTLRAWGSNAQHQLSDGTATLRTTPVTVLLNLPATPINRVKMISAASGQDTLALRSDGTVWAWGANGSGQLGDGTNVLRPLPIQVRAGACGTCAGGFLDNITSVSAGVQDAAAVRADGSAWTWGNNSSGQLADNTTSTSWLPVPVKGTNGLGRLLTVTTVSVGGGHVLALIALDAVATDWGLNDHGQLANGTVSSVGCKCVPRIQPVLGLRGVESVSMGTHHSQAITADGSVWDWGADANGQLGNNITTDSPIPVQVKSPSGVGHLTNMTMTASGSNYTMALRADGTVWAWGQDNFGQLGNNATTDSKLPVRVGPGIVHDIIAINAGLDHGLALQSDGTVWSWGRNSVGNLGDGTTTTRLLPVKVGSLTHIIAISAGSNFSVATRDDGTVWGWGGGISGSLAYSAAPTAIHVAPVQALDSTGLVPLSDVRTAVARGDTTLYLIADGLVWAAGSNAAGQLGCGPACGPQHDFPVMVWAVGASGPGTQLGGVTSLSGGGQHSLALLSDGTVVAWGQNGQGQLGDGTTTSVSVPQAVPRLSGVVAMNGRNGMSIVRGGAAPLPQLTD